MEVSIPLQASPAAPGRRRPAMSSSPGVYAAADAAIAPDTAEPAAGDDGCRVNAGVAVEVEAKEAVMTSTATTVIRHRPRRRAARKRVASLTTLGGCVDVDVDAEKPPLSEYDCIMAEQELRSCRLRERRQQQQQQQRDDLQRFENAALAAAAAMGFPPSVHEGSGSPGMAAHAPAPLDHAAPGGGDGNTADVADTRGRRNSSSSTTRARRGASSRRVSSLVVSDDESRNGGEGIHGGGGGGDDGGGASAEVTASDADADADSDAAAIDADDDALSFSPPMSPAGGGGDADAADGGTASASNPLADVVPLRGGAVGSPAASVSRSADDQSGTSPDRTAARPLAVGACVLEANTLNPHDGGDDNMTLLVGGFTAVAGREQGGGTSPGTRCPAACGACPAPATPAADLRQEAAGVMSPLAPLAACTLDADVPRATPLLLPSAAAAVDAQCKIDDERVRQAHSVFLQPTASTVLPASGDRGDPHPHPAPRSGAAAGVGAAVAPACVDGILHPPLLTPDEHAAAQRLMAPGAYTRLVTHGGSPPPPPAALAALTRAHAPAGEVEALWNRVRPGPGEYVPRAAQRAAMAAVMTQHHRHAPIVSTTPRAVGEAFGGSPRAAAAAGLSSPCCSWATPDDAGERDEDGELFELMIRRRSAKRRARRERQQQQQQQQQSPSLPSSTPAHSPHAPPPTSPLRTSPFATPTARSAPTPALAGPSTEPTMGGGAGLVSPGPHSRIPTLVDDGVGVDSGPRGGDAAARGVPSSILVTRNAGEGEASAAPRRRAARRPRNAIVRVFMTLPGVEEMMSPPGGARAAASPRSFVSGEGGHGRADDRDQDACSSGGSTNTTGSVSPRGSPASRGIAAPFGDDDDSAYHEAPRSARSSSSCPHVDAVCVTAVSRSSAAGDWLAVADQQEHAVDLSSEVDDKPAASATSPRSHAPHGVDGLPSERPGGDPAEPDPHRVDSGRCTVIVGGVDGDDPAADAAAGDLPVEGDIDFDVLSAAQIHTIRAWEVLERLATTASGEAFYDALHDDDRGRLSLFYTARFYHQDIWRRGACGATSVFHLCVKHDNVEFLRYMYPILTGDSEAQAALTRANAAGDTPLHVACRHGLVEMVSYLAHCPWSGKGAVNGLLQTPLQVALQEGHEDCALLLLRHSEVRGGVGRADCKGSAALHYAASQGLLDVAECLLACGAAVDTRNRFGATPVHEATRRGHVDVIDVLLAASPHTVDARDNHGRTPLFCAAFLGQDRAVAMLLEWSPDVDTETNLGHTALQAACAKPTVAHHRCRQLLTTAGCVADGDATAAERACRAAVSRSVLACCLPLCERKGCIRSRNTSRRALPVVFEQ